MSTDFKSKFRIEELSLITFDYWTVSIRPQQPTIGSLVISLNRGADSLGDITQEESTELGKVFSETERLLSSAFLIEKINYLCLMMVDNHVHFHVIPRYSSGLEFYGSTYHDSSWPDQPNLASVIVEPGVEFKVLDHFKQFSIPHKVIGYTTGVFDLFHVGHLNILKNAKQQCDHLIVGVTSDELSMSRKNKRPVIELKERMAIVGALSYVDEVVVQEDMDKFGAWERYKFHKMFVGSDWKGNEKWNQLEIELKKVGSEIIYFPYTDSTSSTMIRSILEETINK